MLPSSMDYRILEDDTASSQLLNTNVPQVLGGARPYVRLHNPRLPRSMYQDEAVTRVEVLSDGSTSTEVIVPSRKQLRMLSRHEPVLPSTQTNKLARLFSLQSLIINMGFDREKALISLVATDAHSVEAALDLITSRGEMEWHPFEESKQGNFHIEKETDPCAKCGNPRSKHIITMQAMNEALNLMEPPSNIPNTEFRNPISREAEQSHLPSTGILWSPSIRREQPSGGPVFRSQSWCSRGKFLQPFEEEKKMAYTETKLNPDASPLELILDFSPNIHNCTICFQDKTELEMGWVLCDSHPDRRFCLECLRSYYKFQVTDGEVLRVVCPDPECEREILEDEIISYLTPELVQKYHKFKETRLIQLSKNARFCTMKDCEGWMVGSCMKRHLCCKQKLICKTCGVAQCFKCGNVWHGYFTRCDRGTDVSYALWSIGKAICKCPKCKARIWKDGGCNHMTCRYCKHEFCWICKGKYSYRHFSSWNIWGCPGMDNSASFIRCPSCFPPWLNRCLILCCVPIWILPCGLIAMVLIPVGLFILVITLPFRCLYYACND